MTGLETVAEGHVAAPLVEAVRESVLCTFEGMCGSRPVAEGTDAANESFEGLAGVISLVGDIQWCLMLGMPRATATQTAMRFCGFELDYESDDMGDVVGEIANVLAGDVVARLDALGVSASLSIPSVARGSELRLMQPGDGPLVGMRFASDEGPFFLFLAARR